MLVTGLIRESLESQKIAAAVRHHNVSNVLLKTIYQRSYDALLPHPLIQHGTLILVPSLFFLSEDEFPSILDYCCSQADQCANGVERDERIIDSAVMAIVMMRNHAALQERVLEWPVKNAPRLTELRKGGCLSAIAIILIPVALFLVFIAAA